MALKIKRLTEKLTPAHVQLAASLGFNFLAKMPGILAVFFILPLVNRSLGPEVYGEFLSALALGSFCTLPFGGINTVGRRLIAIGYGNENRIQQANAFMTTTVSAIVMALVMSAVAYAFARKGMMDTPMLFLVCLLPILAGFLNTFDNLRAGYNEHYITANLQLLTQISIYSAVFLLGLPKGSILLCGLTMQTPYALASLLTCVILLMQRPYLLLGKVKDMGSMVVPALGVIMADGALSALLNFSVYWIGRVGDAPYAAWDGTFVRLFQSFTSPVMLILFPVTSYISIHWQKLSMERRLLLHKLFIVSGIGYGALLGIAMAIGGSYYIRHMFSISVEGDRIDILAVTVFMGAVIAQKTYTLLLYSISEARRVSFGTAGVALLGFCAAALSSAWLPPQKVIDVLFISTGTALPVLLVWESLRQGSTCRIEQAMP